MLIYRSTHQKYWRTFPIRLCIFVFWGRTFHFRPTCVVSNGVSWCVGIAISRRNLWMILCWPVSLAVSPETFCACGGVWLRNNRPPPLARTPLIKVLQVSSTPSVFLRDLVVLDQQQEVRINTRHYHYMLPRNCGSSGMVRSLTCPVSCLRNLSLPVSLKFKYVLSRLSLLDGRKKGRRMTMLFCVLACMCALAPNLIQLTRFYETWSTHERRMFLICCS